MMPSSRTLAMRDAATAAILGVIGAEGTHFGAECEPATFGGEQFAPDGMGSQFGGDWGAEFGNDFGAEFGDYWGADAAPAAPINAALARGVGQHPMSPMHPANQGKMLALWNQHHAGMNRTQKRQNILEPNLGSSLKVERYEFPLNQTLTLGTTVALNMSNNPDVTIRPQRLITNAPSAGFCTLSNVKVSNVGALVGGGSSSDAFNYSALAVGSMLDLPTLNPAQRASITGTYTGLTPPGFVAAASFLFVASFQGPATIVGQ